jgi:hypothetical protein
MEKKLLDAIKLGQRMRAAQTAFFRSTDRVERAKALTLSRKLEREFDDTAKYLLGLGETHA